VVGDKILEQLKCNGTLETVRIRKAGYAQKFKVEDFIERYAMLLAAESIAGIRNLLDGFTWKVCGCLGSFRLLACLLFAVRLYDSILNVRSSRRGRKARRKCS
jgi:hypothetical protein